ncbi:MAG: non-hydrolyzing UDP-N-acetylglucosamine 2-epimerase [Chthonomonadales bacterium]
MITVLSVFGTRPEAIKMAPVVRRLQRYPEEIRSVVCSTGQHREMLDQVLALFDIRPDYDLNLMEPNQSLCRLTANLFLGLEPVLDVVRPDWVVAQGDTTTVLAASLAAYYKGARFAHVEAGLRTGDKRRPFPEEINRRLADAVSDLYFCPTDRARRTLLAEGYPDAAVLVTGNTVIDALLDVAARPYDWASGPLAGVPSAGPLVLVTAHRRESFGAPFRMLCEAIRELAERFPDVHFVYPVHLNPNVRSPVEEILSARKNIHLLEPLDYLSLVHLMKRSTLILTDSGGIQEEAPGLGVPVLVMRDTTERPEGVEAGVVKLVGTDRALIVEEASRLLTDADARAAMASGVNPYGDGRAAERIVDALLARS